MRLEAGERLGEWEVVAPIARGGQGAVLRARHVRTGAPAAIKALVDPSDAAARRFAQEARVLERVAHRNVVRALDRGQAPGGAWLALELIEGEDLLSVVRRGVPPFEATARALGAVAQALDHCHRLGVVHRDLKPSNVIVERGTGRAVLVDFGLVKRDAAAMHLSSLDGEGEVLSLAGEVKGTPEYMAPEQVAERFGEVGPATDVWGLGATLFHLLTGEAPFGRGAAPVVMRKITRQPARDPRAVNPAVPEALAALCLRCLAKAPAERPGALEVAGALFAFAGRRVDAPPPAPSPPASGSPRLPAPTPPSDPPPARPRLPARLPAPGEAFAGFRIVRPLGRGAFGAVLEAVGPDGAPCALKVLHAVDTGDARARFLREAEAGRVVDHPGVVRALGHGEERGLLWLAMELVPGARPLDAYVTENALPLAARVRLLAEVAHAVDAAHRAGLVHRDLKPQNVLVSSDGRPKVVDLGLARHLDKERLTMSGAFMGTVHYMAPEQVTGRVTEVGPATDVWALGVMLHELIAGARPFEGDALIEVMAAILEDAPPDPCAGVPDAPPALRDVVARALAREPGQRFASAADFGRAALAALEQRPGGRRARPAVVLGALGLAAALLVVGLTVVRARLREAERRARLDALNAEAAALVAGEAPLARDLWRIRALREALEEVEAPDPALLARARALEALALLAAGELEGARAAAAGLSHERTPEALALRGGLALDQDPLQAAQDLGRALDEGVVRADVRAWRARALAARGPTPRDAATVLADLEALERARPLAGDEVGWRARALLALDRPDDAAAALSGRDDAPLDVRWRVALTRADALLEGVPVRAREALAGLAAPAPPPCAEPAARLAARAVRALERLAAIDELERVAALAGVVATVAPEAASPAALAALQARALEIAPDVSEARYELALALARLAPDDAERLLALGLLSQHTRHPARKRGLLELLRRGLALVPPDRRGEGEVLLCGQLALLIEEDLEHGRPSPDAEECVALSTRLLESARTPHERATLLWARACARRTRGDLEGALRDLDAARAAVPIDAHERARGEVLLAVGRLDDGLEALIRYVEAQAEDHRAGSQAAARVWDVGRRERRLEHVRRAVAAQARLAPTSPLWQARLAWVQRATGDFGAVGSTLARVADALELEGDHARAARARELSTGAIPGRALDELVEELARVDASDAAR